VTAKATSTQNALPENNIQLSNIMHKKQDDDAREQQCFSNIFITMYFSLQRAHGANRLMSCAIGSRNNSAYKFREQLLLLLLF